MCHGDPALSWDEEDQSDRTVGIVGWQKLGLSRYAAYRALKTLEGRGLVSVDRHRGRKPLVTVIELEAGGVATSPSSDVGQESGHG